MRTLLYVTGMTMLSALNQWSAALLGVAQANARERAMKENPDLVGKLYGQKTPVGFRINGDETIH